MMRHAVGGVLSLMRASSLIFAPHRNSYRRLTPNAHVASEVCWGYETRAAAVRIPGRVERGAADRAPGGGGGRQPVPGAGGDPRGGARGDREPDRAAGADGERARTALPIDWKQAIDAFEHSESDGADLRAGAARDLPRDEEAGAAGLLAADQPVRARDLPGDRVRARAKGRARAWNGAVKVADYPRSYYAASREPGAGAAGARGRAGGRGLHRRRGVHRAVGGAGAGRARARGRGAGRRQGRLGRVGAERRADRQRAEREPRDDRAALRARRRPTSSRRWCRRAGGSSASGWRATGSPAT